MLPSFFLTIESLLHLGGLQSFCLARCLSEPSSATASWRSLRLASRGVHKRAVQRSMSNLARLCALFFVFSQVKFHMQKGFEKGARGPPQDPVGGSGDGPLAFRENTNFLSKCEVLLWENRILRKCTVLQPLSK